MFRKLLSLCRREFQRIALCQWRTGWRQLPPRYGVATRQRKRSEFCSWWLLWFVICPNYHPPENRPMSSGMLMMILRRQWFGVFRDDLASAPHASKDGGKRSDRARYMRLIEGAVLAYGHVCRVFEESHLLATPFPACQNRLSGDRGAPRCRQLGGSGMATLRSPQLGESDGMLIPGVERFWRFWLGLPGGLLDDLVSQSVHVARALSSCAG